MTLELNPDQCEVLWTIVSWVGVLVLLGFALSLIALKPRKWDPQLRDRKGRWIEPPRGDDGD